MTAVYCCACLGCTGTPDAPTPPTVVHPAYNVPAWCEYCFDETLASDVGRDSDGRAVYCDDPEREAHEILTSNANLCRLEAWAARARGETVEADDLDEALAPLDRLARASQRNPDALVVDVIRGGGL